METQTIRVYIPVDLTIPTEHVEMVFSEEWSDSFYSFDSLAEFGLYAARLMMFNFLDEKLPASCLTGFDGHCVDSHKGYFEAAIPCYKGWELENIETWVKGTNE